jgi:hypothetical protein
MMSLTPDIYNTIYGFVYVCAGFFFILHFADRHSLAFLERTKTYAPFIGIIVLFLSYTVGQIAYIVSEGLLGMIHQDWAYHVEHEISIRLQTPEKLEGLLISAYQTLVTLRHLTLGSLLLGVSVSLWLRGRDSKLATVLLATCLVCALLCGIAYGFFRRDFQQTRCQIEVVTSKVQVDQGHATQ